MTSQGGHPARVVLSVIITNWNTRALLRDLLASIDRHRPPFGFEVIVVDNGSADDSRSMVSESFPWVVLLGNDRNLGYARANNQGYACAQGEFVLLLGSDTVIIDDCMERMVQGLLHSPGWYRWRCLILN